MKYEIIRITDRPELKQQAAEWFCDKWKLPVEAYRESMEEAINGASSVPQWYCAIKDGRIIGGMGVIENDFHPRKDIAPNVCAVYTEDDCRGQGIAGKLLNFVCADMKENGIDTLYLFTQHKTFYERYGWEYFCNVVDDSGEDMRVYIHKA
ncbi:MAG: GNAT family N-acetyltransferase [Oscillospiraceae bacterium]